MIVVFFIAAFLFYRKIKDEKNSALIWLQPYSPGVNIILSLIPDGIGLESTFWALKYTFRVIVNLNKFILNVY